jgi:hypothetical protein
MNKEYRFCLVTSAAVAILLSAAASSAVAWGLSDEDYDYLRHTQNLERYDQPILDLSPRERVRLHELITDPKAANDPVVRDRTVRQEIALFLSHRSWEEAHPGKLWDAAGSMFPN